MRRRKTQPDPAPPASVGDQELVLLRFVAEREGGATVGEAAEALGRERGLARSTVLTMMERLRQKGHLRRRRVHGVYRYTSPASPGEVLRGVVEGFVERTLGGSVAPVVAYLAETSRLSDDELAELEAIVERLADRRQGDGGEDGGDGRKRSAGAADAAARSGGGGRTSRGEGGR